MPTFTPNPENYTLETAPDLTRSTCPQCAMYDPEKEQCDGGPAGTWVDQCLARTAHRRVWVLRPEIAAQ